MCFSSLLDIDKLIPATQGIAGTVSFSSLLDIDKLILLVVTVLPALVLVLCWILINLYYRRAAPRQQNVLVLCWILINLYARCFIMSLAWRFSSLLDIDKLIPIPIQ